MEIKGDDQLSGAQQWMTKSLTEEKTMKSFSRVSGKGLLGGQRGRPGAHLALPPPPARLGRRLWSGGSTRRASQLPRPPAARAALSPLDRGGRPLRPSGGAVSRPAVGKVSGALWLLPGQPTAALLTPITLSVP